ncbi:MAG: hypothetical protein K2N51_17040 [Lachnospiraceae bacterium]|nr:hypothetical protein [Lachnospiraceae bacterium]
MKYTIHGFSQEKAIQYGLDDGDLMALRWFVDYKDGKGMIKKTVKGEVYYWVNYEKLAEAFPIRKWSKDTVYRRFKKMVKQKILSHQVIRQGGVWSYYNLGEKYSELIDDRKEESKPDDNKKEIGKESEGFGEKSEQVGKESEHNGKKPGTKNSSINNSSITNSFKEKYKKESQRLSPDKERTISDDVVDYINQSVEDKIIADKVLAVLRTRLRRNKSVDMDAVSHLLEQLEVLSKGDYQTKLTMLDNSIAGDYYTVYPIKQQHYQEEKPSYNVSEYENYNILDEINWGLKNMGKVKEEPAYTL